MTNFSQLSLEYWKERNSLFKTDAVVDDKIALKRDNTDLSLTEVSDYMNTYFATIGHNLAKTITLDNSTYIKRLIETEPNDQLVSWRPTNIEEISIIIDD